MQWLLPIRLGDATAAFISVTSLTWTVSKRHERRQDKKEPSSHIPSPLCHNNSFHFRGQDGAMVYCSKSWTVGFLESDIYPWANPGKESELVIIALIPEPNAQHLIFSPFPKHTQIHINISENERAINIYLRHISNVRSEQECQFLIKLILLKGSKGQSYWEQRLYYLKKKREKIC